MKVLVLTLGTRGDVQPFVALARGLQRRGHRVVVAAPERLAGTVTGNGVDFAALDDGPLRVLDAGSTVGEIATGGVRAKLALMRRLPAMFTRVLDDCWEVASTGAGAGAQVIVHNGQVIAGQHVAEKLGPGRVGAADADVCAHPAVSVARPGVTAVASGRIEPRDVRGDEGPGDDVRAHGGPVAGPARVAAAPRPA
jgi:sterol 3beta-glucosyltransferase